MRPVVKFGGDVRGSKKVLPAWVGTDSLETKCVSLRNHGAQTPTDLTFSKKLGRDKNSNDKTGIKVASSPCNPNSCKKEHSLNRPGWLGKKGKGEGITFVIILGQFLSLRSPPPSAPRLRGKAVMSHQGAYPDVGILATVLLLGVFQ